MQLPKEVYGLTIVRAPGGGLVLVGGPIDLTRAESLSPRWVREKKETRPTRIKLPPDKENGKVREVVSPVLTVVGKYIVHGESVGLMQRHVNREMGKLLNMAMHEPEQPLELLEQLQRPTKAEPKHIQETPAQKRERAERALGLKGKPDDFVRAVLLKMGRRHRDVEKYIRERNAPERVA